VNKRNYFDEIILSMAKKIRIAPLSPTESAEKNRR